MNIKEKITDGIVVFDGALGTELQKRGLKPGEHPEEWNLTHKRDIIEIHKSYIEAGADVINANTFGVNRLNFPGRIDEIISAAFKNAKTAREECKKECFITLDIGSLGKLLKPAGEIEFEEAVSIFKEVVLSGVKNGADLILIETMTDSLETKAAVIAAKENSDLPVFVSNAYDASQRLLSGTDAQTMVAILEGLGVDAIGINCSLGPKQMKPIVEDLLKFSSTPVFVCPNAGLPREENGKTVFDVNADEFAEIQKEFLGMGVHGIGGCCGTTPEFINKLSLLKAETTPLPLEEKNYTVVTSYAKSVYFGERPVLIGERINPTGKSKFKQALKDNNISYILGEATGQKDKKVHILDVNVGLPEINETEMMCRSIQAIQAVVDLPLQIDTSDFDAMEKAMRLYNGKPMINSVNGKTEVMEKVFPLVKKYGGVVVGLTLDENGIPETADGRIEIAKRIYDTAEKYEISKKDIVIDPLALTISSDKKSAVTTLEAVRKIKEELNGNTILGVSNISFGLPERDNINSAFFTMAMQKGLSSAIINPYSDKMMQSYYSFIALNDCENGCEDYIDFASVNKQEVKVNVQEIADLKTAIEKGLSEKAALLAEDLIKVKDSLEIINEFIVPALDNVGDGFEKKTVFLPQLLMSANAAKAAFDVIKKNMTGKTQESKGRIILATVKGDIHDIGKNIVKVLLENYSFDVIDLGKDVSPETIVETAKKENVKLVGLSALMTTTVPAMKETIRLLKENLPQCKTVVGGAVLTEEYANSIGADKYAKDAMETVRYAESIEL
ncbi:MAG: homocysteine S-methyltransferase family protein [Clostridia bacterium]|nr:homocysteine S-methyltransferase family protein [Clostridia bacterium]